MSTSTYLRRRILVTGATGQQGGAVIKAFQEHSPPFEYELLALTRSASSKKAKTLAQQPNVTVIEGNLDAIETVFEQAGGLGSVWGLFLVQTLSASKKPEESTETVQGKGVVDASLKYGVQHFVYTSVDRHGNESEKNPTPIPHFITKHMIEDHLRLKAQGSKMTYTILRPVAFMENLTPTFLGRTFAAMWAGMGDTKLQLISVRDIGTFAVQAFSSSETDEYKNTAISLAGDELSRQEAGEIFFQVLHRPMPQTYSLVGTLVQTMVSELGVMFQWFVDVGYDADIQKCRKLHGGLLNLTDWLKQESQFKR